MTYSIQVDNQPAPAFIQLIDESGNPAYSDYLKPSSLAIFSTSNDDFIAYSGKTLTLVLTVGTGAGLKTLSRSYGLFIFPDCTAAKVPMTLQTLPQFSFIVSQQTLPPSYGYVNSLTFGKVEMLNPSDSAACGVGDSSLQLFQLDKAVTVSSAYDPNLFEFVPNQAISSNEIVLKPSLNMHVTIDPPSTPCSL